VCVELTRPWRVGKVELDIILSGRVRFIGDLDLRFEKAPEVQL